MEKKTWEEFCSTRLLWWVNRSLHLFGWAIVVEYDNQTNQIVEVFPARLDVRGFPRDVEEEGFLELTKYLNKSSKDLLDEINN